MKRLWMSVAVVLVCCSVAAAQKPKNKVKTAYLTPEEAPVDFLYQGEYTGKIRLEGEMRPIGLQVVALGDGRFDAVAYVGGLPGAGWNGYDKIDASGSLKDGVLTVYASDGYAVIKEGKATVYNNSGEKLGELKKVLRKSPTLGKKPPRGAVVIFDGTSTDRLAAGKVVEGGLLAPKIVSKDKFQDCHIHLEFRLAFMPYARGQARSNSGCYVQGRYEVQILDSFGLEGKDNECGGIYKVKAPDVNMCFPPLSWQTYDIDFKAARFDENGKKIANARITVRHNGVLIHKDLELPNVTPGGVLGSEGPEPGPIYLQFHGDPVRFRNIWVVPKQ